MIKTLQVVNVGLAFFLELAMLASFGYWGFYGDKSLWVKWVLGIGLPILVAVFWGIFLAPNAVHRLNITGGAIISLLLFVLAATALFYTQYRTLALVFVAIAVINRVLMLLWKQW